jgi:hypothetical protein
VPEVNATVKHAGGRPRIADGESWLEGLLADAPKLAVDIVAAAEPRGISERSLSRIKTNLFRQLNAGQEGEPWRAFQRGSHWFWGDSRKMPKPPKRDSFGRPIREDGSVIIDDAAPVVSKELEQMNVDWAAKHKQSPVMTALPPIAQPVESSVPSTPIWEDRELWAAFSVAKESRLREFVSQINNVEGELTDDMHDCLAALYAALEAKTVKQ